jgi:hypothetical protein
MDSSGPGTKAAETKAFHVRMIRNMAGARTSAPQQMGALKRRNISTSSAPPLDLSHAMIR